METIISTHTKLDSPYKLTWLAFSRSMSFTLIIWSPWVRSPDVSAKLPGTYNICKICIVLAFVLLTSKNSEFKWLSQNGTENYPKTTKRLKSKFKRA